jgi:hypothetical protein
MRVVVAVVRIAVVVLVGAAVIATFEGSASREAVNPFNFFGYFTIQSNILLAAILAATVVLGLAGRPVPYWLDVARAAWTTYMIITGLVYNTLLTNLPGGGGVVVPWANTVLHVVFPIYALLDWLLVGDRPRLSWRHLWWVAIDPLVWLVVVLIRGATDGWVPYPFLNPANGYLSVFVYVILIAVAVMGVGALVFVASRWRILRVDGSVPEPAAA